MISRRCVGPMPASMYQNLRRPRHRSLLPVYNRLEQHFHLYDQIRDDCADFLVSIEEKTASPFQSPVEESLSSPRRISVYCRQVAVSDVEDLQ